MFLKNSKSLIYIILFIFVLGLIIPVSAYAFDEDSIYVWSNNDSSISTSNTADTKNSESNDEIQENSR